jgi:hypothetical protein
LIKLKSPPIAIGADANVTDINSTRYHPQDIWCNWNCRWKNGIHGEIEHFYQRDEDPPTHGTACKNIRTILGVR